MEKQLAEGEKIQDNSGNKVSRILFLKPLDLF